MGSTTNPTDYSVPHEAQTLFINEILNNPLLPPLPAELKEAAQYVRFAGNASPSIPINWRFAESAASLKAFEASMLNVLRSKKYGTALADVEINTDHASLFIMSPFLGKVISKDGAEEDVFNFDPKFLEKYGFKDTDLHRANASLQRVLATNIYKTRDGRFYHVHGSMNPEPTLRALGMDLEGDSQGDYDSVVKRFQDVVGELESQDLDELMNEHYRQAGTICRSVEEFWQTEHGKANAHVGLYELHKSSKSSQPASWWPSAPATSPQRPLAGLKVVDLTRVIASPAISRSLAEMGASVMRVTSPHVTDMSSLHQDLNWGKWNCSLHLKDESDRLKLIGLIREADVVVEGYRPGVMEKYGLSREEIFKLVEGRGRGIVHVKENCYGWHGPWAHRSGWQQISDACCGVSHAYGRAMGFKDGETVTPVFPNSDYCTGIIGSSATLHALLRRGEEGGSYGVDVSLNYYSQWLTRLVGEYPKDVWEDVWARHGKPVFRHYHAMGYLLPSVTKLLRERDGESLFKDEFFVRRTSKAVGYEFVSVKPVARFEDGVELGYKIGTRGNGVDAPRWPEDLSVEVVV